MSPDGAFAKTGDLGELSERRKTTAGLVGKCDQALECPAQVSLEGAVQVKSDRDKSQQNSLHRCSSTRPEAAVSRAKVTRGKNRLAKTSRIAEGIGRQTDIFFDPADMQTRPLPGRVLRFWGSGAAPRVDGAVRATDSRAK